MPEKRTRHRIAWVMGVLVAGVALFEVGAGRVASRAGGRATRPAEAAGPAEGDSLVPQGDGASGGVGAGERVGASPAPFEVTIGGFVTRADGRRDTDESVEVEVCLEGRPVAIAAAKGGAFLHRFVQRAAECAYRVIAVGRGSGRSSVPHEIRLSRREPSTWVLLRLHDTFRLSGRIVGEGGRGLSGREVRVGVSGLASVPAWAEQEGSGAELDARTDGEGTFRFSLPRRRGSVWCRSAAGAWTRLLEYEPPTSAALDLGAIPEPAGEVALWSLRLVDDYGRPVPGACVAGGPDDAWSFREHPAFDERLWAVRADADGWVRLPLGCRSEVVCLGVGGPAHETRAIALACDRPGAREAVVALRERSGCRVRLRGEALAALLSRGRDLTLDVVAPRRSGDRSFAPVDPLSGRPVDAPSAGVVPPATLLDARTRSLPIVRLAENLWEIRASDPGSLGVAARLGGCPVAEWEIPVGAGFDPHPVELFVPPGRLLRIAHARPDRNSFAAGCAGGLSRFAAWLRLPARLRADRGAFDDAAGIGHLVQLDVEKAAETEIWAPDGVDAVGFGYVEPSAGGSLVPAPSTRPRYVAVPPEAVPQILVPDLEERPSRVSVRIRRDGLLLQEAGLPVTVVRKTDASDGPLSARGSALVRTGASGEAEIALFPGSYWIGVDGTVALWAPVALDVRPGPDSTLTLDLLLP